MVKVERVRYSDTLEREKILAMIKARKEKQKEQSFENEKAVCPECGSRNLVHDYERAELVCGDCGLVIDADLVDEGPEWRAFDHDQGMKRSRVGAPMTYTIHDKGLSTKIDWRNRESYGKSIPSKIVLSLIVKQWPLNPGSNALKKPVLPLDLQNVRQSLQSSKLDVLKS